MNKITIKKAPSKILISIIISVIILMIVNVVSICFLFNFDIANKLDSRTVHTLVEQKSEIKELKIQLEKQTKQNDILLKDTVANNSKIKELKDQNDILKARSSELSTQLSKISESPIFIKSIKVGNVYNSDSIETNYGDEIQAKNTMFLKPQIEYISIGNQNREIELYVKLFANGTLMKVTGRTDSDLFNYTFNSKITTKVEDKVTLVGVGGSSKGQYRTGDYRYEIWCNNVCLKSIEFKIH